MARSWRYNHIPPPSTQPTCPYNNDGITIGMLNRASSIWSRVVLLPPHPFLLTIYLAIHYCPQRDGHGVAKTTYDYFYFIEKVMLIKLVIVRFGLSVSGGATHRNNEISSWRWRLTKCEMMMTRHLVLLMGDNVITH